MQADVFQGAAQSVFRLQSKAIQVRRLTDSVFPHWLLPSPSRTTASMEPTPYETTQLLLAAARLALQMLEEHCPEAPETALLLLAIHKASGAPTAEG